TSPRTCQSTLPLYQPRAPPTRQMARHTEWGSALVVATRTSSTTVPPAQSGSVLLDCHTGDDASSNLVGTLPDAVLLMARRIASASGSRSKGNSRSARWSVTTTRFTSESTRGRAIRDGTGVTRPTHMDDSCGDSTGTGSSRRRGSPATSAYVAIMSAYDNTS